MSSRKKFLAAAALTASLTAGGALGAMFGAPGISSAQTEPDQSAERAERPAAESRHHGNGPRRGRPGHHGRHIAFAAAAEALGMTPEELKTELQDGQSVRAVAEARGVDVQSVIDAIVAAVTEQAEERATDFVNRERPADEEGRRGPRREAPPAEGTAA